jgi:hypothetical protein
LIPREKMQDRQITLVKKGTKFYARLALTDSAGMVLPPSQILLKARTKREARKAIATLRAIYCAVDNYGQGKPYSLPPQLRHVEEAIPSYAHYVWREGAKALEAMRHNN